MTEETTAPNGVLVDYDVRKVMAALPHRYPLLLVDRVASLTLNERIHAVYLIKVEGPEVENLCQGLTPPFIHSFKLC